MLTKVLTGIFSSLLLFSAVQLTGCAMNDTEDDGMENSSSKSFEEQLKENEMKKEKQMQ